jgi:hypothetical protein
MFEDVVEQLSYPIFDQIQILANPPNPYWLFK